MRYRINAAFLACLGTETMLFARELLSLCYWRDLIQLDHSFLLAITLSVRAIRRAAFATTLSLESLAWLQALSSEKGTRIFHDTFISNAELWLVWHLHSKPQPLAKVKPWYAFLNSVRCLQSEYRSGAILSLQLHGICQQCAEIRNLWQQPIDRSSLGCLHSHTPRLDCLHQADFP